MYEKIHDLSLTGCGHFDDGMTGKSFTDTCYRFTEAVVIGVRFANPKDPKVLDVMCVGMFDVGSRLQVKAFNPAERPVILNPPGDYIMQYGDKVKAM